MKECTVVTLPKDRYKVLPIKRRRLRRIPGFAGPKLYVGLEDKLPRPKEKTAKIEDKWKKVEVELKPYTERIGMKVSAKCQTSKVNTIDSGFEPHLLLAGLEVEGSITLSPKIWYSCQASWIVDIVRNEVDGLDWPVHYGLGDKIECQLDRNLGLAQATVRLPKQLNHESGGLDLPSGYTMFVNFQDPDDTQAACGLLCSVASFQGDDLKNHSLCRIGGVLTICALGGKPRNMAVTAAHGLLDYFLTARVGLPPRPRTLKTLCWSGWWRSSTAGLRWRNKYLDDLNDNAKPVSTERIGHLDEDRVDKIDWRPVQRVHAVNWLGGGWETTGHWHMQFPIPAHSLEQLASDSDFALLELPSQVINTYVVGQERKMVTRLLRESEMKCGPVELILASDHAVPATLLYDTPSLYLRGALFPTRKIQLDNPLAAGTSGSWVVQDGGLCGIIVANYEDRPFAHILTAEKLISDIKKTLGNHVEISLPSVLPSPVCLPGVPTPQSFHPSPGKADRSHLHWENDDTWGQSRDDEPSIATRLREALGPAIAARLREALVPSSTDRTQFFLPLSAQRNLLSRGFIETIVRRYYSSSPALNDDPAAGDLCDYICGEKSLHEQEPRKTARMILAVLILIEIPSRIFDFFHERVYDDDLPLKRVDEQGANFTLAKKSSTTAVKCFSGWSPAQILHFDKYQWSMVAPFFTSSHTPLFYDFHDRTILPFTACRDLGRTPMQTIEVHPAHHAFNHLELPRGSTDSFALKRPHFASDNVLDAEIEASQIIPRHPHLLTCLCTFQYLDVKYILFPNADGGNLSNVWEIFSNRPLVTAQLLEWVLVQCEGLASGLAAIHNPVQTPTGCAMRGLHGNIRPRSVLWFRDGGHDNFSRGYGILQLGDYGLAQFSRDSSSRSLFEPKGPNVAYGPPETLDCANSVGQSSDIWGLGCVYLEFVTWLLHGQCGLEDLYEMRSQGIDLYPFQSPPFYEESEQIWRRGKARFFRVKHSVSEWIRRLKKTSGCPEHLQQFLRLIEDSMLQVNSRKRSSAKEIAHRLRIIQEIPFSKVSPEAPAEAELTLPLLPETVPPPLEPEQPPGAAVVISKPHTGTTVPEGKKPVSDRSFRKHPHTPDPLPSDPSSSDPTRPRAPKNPLS